ncbi:MAG: hypothetical protein RL172_780 [Bacteroidota bacterium]|jgi:hypothetical protein
MTKTVVCIFGAWLLLATSCSSDKGKVLSPQKMEVVMWDFLQADTYTEFYLKKDSSINATLKNAALQQKVFELHKISKEDFYKSYQYYNNKPEEMRMILDSVSAKAERKRSMMMERKYSNPKPVN